MGQLIITPSFVDLSAGSAWASLGGNTVPAQTAVQQVCDDLKNGTRTAGVDVHCTVQVGLNAVATTPSDTIGLSVSGGGESIPFITPTTKSWAAYRSILLGLSNPNTLQVTAWNGLPGSPPTVNSQTWSSVFFLPTVMAMFDATDPSFVDNSVAGSAGLHQQTGVDQHGLDSGGSFYELAFHEITEAILSRVGSFTSSTTITPWDAFTYSSAGVRTIERANTRHLSHDGGTTNIASLNTVSGNDSGDFSGLANDAFNAFGPNGPVSRDAATPLQQRDWQALALYLPLSNTGNSWAGLSNIAPSFGSVGLRFHR